MRKTLLSLLLAAVSCMASAQTYKAFPYEINYYLASIKISPNGKYIGGMDYTGVLFLADWATLDIVQQDPPSDTATGCIRGINSSGTAVGFNDDDAVKIDLNGNYTVIYDADDGAIADGITEDGSIICGKTGTNNTPKACIWKNGELQYLPEPTDAFLGIKNYGTACDYISNDGSVIVGHLVDKLSTRPMLLWVRNKDGETYSCIPVFKRFCTEKTNDGNGIKQYFMPTGLSGNGEWAAVTCTDDAGNLAMGRYNIVTDELQIINLPDMKALVGYDDMVVQTSGIADDGTLLGIYGDTDQGVRWGLICKAGETDAKLLSDAFPTLTDLKHFDSTQYNVPADITPDGRYITGHATDYIMVEGESAQIFVSYVIDTWDESADVKQIAVKRVDGNASLYGIDGKKLDKELSDIILIKRGADGKTFKFVRK